MLKKLQKISGLPASGVWVVLIVLFCWGIALAEVQKSGPDLFRLRMPEAAARELALEYGGAEAMRFPWVGGEWSGRLYFDQGRLSALCMIAQQAVPLADMLQFMAERNYVPLWARPQDPASPELRLYALAATGFEPQERADLVLSTQHAAGLERVLFVSRDLFAVFTHAVETDGNVAGVRTGNLRARVFEWRAGLPETVVLTTLERVR